MHLHIVSFNVPWPANYGGVIDVYYRVRALARAGVKVHLHCYTYGRRPAAELEQWCEEVCYYRRTTLPHKLLTRRPYIVSSRCSQPLLQRLLCDDYPVLLEGLHNGWVLEQLRAMERGEDASHHRTVLLRAHNVEHEYYRRLTQAERNPLRRLYLAMDARKLQRYEPVMLQGDAVLAVTQADADHFRDMGCGNVVLLPSSHQYDDIVSLTGRGDYAVYHGDLSVPENVQAASYLVKQVFAGSRHRLVLAGRNPAAVLQQLAHAHANVIVEPNPTDLRMERLIAEAQVNILVTNQPTGLKLKLLHSLYCGRHCLVNSQMVAGTQLDAPCCVADDAEAMRRELDRLMSEPFTEEHIRQRRRLLGTLYSPAANAGRLVDLLAELT